MKVQWSAGLLLWPVVVDSFKPTEFCYESSETQRIDIAKSVSGRIKYQSPPADSDLIPKFNTSNPEEDWEVNCSSVYKGNKCRYAIDDKSETSWRSDPSQAEPPSIIVNLRREYYVSGLTMLPWLHEKIDRCEQIAEHRIFLSRDCREWKQVAYGTWGSNKSPKMSAFIPSPARYIKLVAETESCSNGTTKKPGQISIVNLAVYAYNANHFPNDEPTKGVWGPTINLPVIPVAAAVEKHGNVIMWSAWADDQYFASPGGKTLTTTMDRGGCITQTKVYQTKHDMFCPGISMDGDGNLVVSGGADAGQTSVYNGTAWEGGPRMDIDRGYHASTTLSDGRIFTIGGSFSGGDKIEKVGEVYTPWDKTWVRRRGCRAKPIMTDDRLGQYRADNHAWLFGWKNASVFQAGPSTKMHWFNVDEDTDAKHGLRGTYEYAGDRGKDKDSMSGSAVMYDATRGKIVTFGGQRHYDGSLGSRNAHLITLGEAYEKPTVEVAGKGRKRSGEGGMHHRRVYHTSVVLPDGKVFTTGGQSWGKPFHEENITFTPEMYDPETDTFVEQSRNNIKRVYHSISVLLPNATVLNGGGGLCGNCSANHYDAEIFTPPYLFTPDGRRATRPRIVDVQGGSRTAVGGVLRFKTDSEIKAASLVRLATNTHTVNTDQRRVPLNDLKPLSVTDYNATLPEDPGIILPGWYMLFVLNGQGTPSEAEMVQVTLASGSSSGSSKDVGEAEREGFQSETLGEACQCDHWGSASFLVAWFKNIWRIWKSALITQA